MHIAIAEQIANKLGIIHKAYGPDADLGEHGWIHINDSGHVVDEHLRYPLTQAQLDTMWDLAQRHPSMQPELMVALQREQTRQEKE